jgi:hypothetical protein
MKITVRKKLIGKSLILFGLLFLAYAFLESRWIRITDIEIRSADVPGSLNG